MEVQDLDLLRPEPRILRIGGKEVDVSFVPCGITFELDRLINRLAELGRDEAFGTGGDVDREAFETSVRICVLFCERKHPGLDYEWFMDNADPGQIKVFTAAVRDALMRAYSGVGESKNAVAPEETT